MIQIFTDIETIPDQRPDAMEHIEVKVPGSYKKPESIQKYIEENREAEWRKTALDGSSGELFCIGFGFNKGDVLIEWRGKLDNPVGEKVMLENFFHAVSTIVGERADGFPERIQWVGHCVQFDLDFIWQRAMIHGVRPPFPIPEVKKWNDEHVFDTSTAWCRGAYGKRISLKNLARALNIPCKEGGMDGSQVWDAVKDGRHSDVLDYCIGDVVTVREIYRRLTWS